MQHAAERVERPGESQEALDRKKAYLPSLRGFRPVGRVKWHSASLVTRVVQRNCRKR